MLLEFKRKDTNKRVAIEVYQIVSVVEGLDRVRSFAIINVRGGGSFELDDTFDEVIKTIRNAFSPLGGLSAAPEYTKSAEDVLP